MLLFGALILISGTIDLNNLPNYANQDVPDYINKDNTGANLITDAGATLGRVLFYDKKLSSDNQISCASCHKQEFAFSDTADFSQGVNGETGRHSMRLINNRFADEVHYFWDERADSLEKQTTMPIRDHKEMGYSDTLGDPGFSDLIAKLDSNDYYNTLFKFVYGDTIITEERMQKAMAQFVRSIQSFDSKYDQGRSFVSNDSTPFPNFTVSENAGKELFINLPHFDSVGVRTGGGAGCAQCHRPPEFDIDPNSLHNQSGMGNDSLVTRAPSLRDLVNPLGQINGNFMHNALFKSLEQVIFHYEVIYLIAMPYNNNIDPRLKPNGHFQNLNFTQQEKIDLESFLRTLTSQDVYTDPKWSDPFDANGNIDIIDYVLGMNEFSNSNFNIYPNPVVDKLYINGNLNDVELEIYNQSGQLVQSVFFRTNSEICFDLSTLKSAFYILHIKDTDGKIIKRLKFIKK